MQKRLAGEGKVVGVGVAFVGMDAPVETGDFDGRREMRNENPSILSSYILTKPLTPPLTTRVDVSSSSLSLPT